MIRREPQAPPERIFPLETAPWELVDVPDHGAYCNICGWHGGEFESYPHPEYSICGRCRSIARERAMHWTWLQHWEPHEWAQVVETSPRLGYDYRHHLTHRLRYRGSDFDERAHAADLHVDLQAIDMDDSTLDVVLTSHVLEHVPDTMRALRELRRVLTPGGIVVLQVPLLEPVTVVPSTPEFHGDDTPVFWRFGWDLADMLTDAGFETTTNVTQDTADAVERGRWEGPRNDELDADAVVLGGQGRDLHVVADSGQQHRLGLLGTHPLVTWVGRVPGTPQLRAPLGIDELRHYQIIYPTWTPAPLRVPEEEPWGDNPPTWGQVAAPVLHKVLHTGGRLKRRLRRRS